MGTVIIPVTQDKHTQKLSRCQLMRQRQFTDSNGAFITLMGFTSNPGVRAHLTYFTNQY